MARILCFFLLSLAIIISCSKKKEDGPVYTLEEFMNLAHETTSSPEKANSLKFSDYSPGVNKLESKALAYKRLSFFALSFETPTQARAEALRLNQYFSRNWLFDRVEGEPVLEDYVIETFGAQNPNRAVQRKPKKQESHSEGSEAHGQTHH